MQNINKKSKISQANIKGKKHFVSIKKKNKTEEKKIKQNKTEYSINNSKIERKKTLTMWFGVIFFMVIILLVWIINLKHSFKNIETTNKISKQLNWSEITDNFSKTMDQMGEKLNEAKKNTNNIENQEYKNSATTQNNIIDNKEIATSTTVVNGNDILMLKKKLESL